MIAVPGSTTAETISAIIADEAAVGMVNNKTTAVRIIPRGGKDVGDMVELGGLLGSAPVMPVHEAASTDFIARGGRIPAPLQSPGRTEKRQIAVKKGALRAPPCGGCRQSKS